MNRPDLEPVVSALAPLVPVSGTGWGHLPHPNPAVEANVDRLPDDLFRLHVANQRMLNRLAVISVPLSYAPPEGGAGPVHRVESINGNSWDGYVTFAPAQIPALIEWVFVLRQLDGVRLEQVLVGMAGAHFQEDVDKFVARIRGLVWGVPA